MNAIAEVVENTTETPKPKAAPKKVAKPKAKAKKAKTAAPKKEAAAKVHKDSRLKQVAKFCHRRWVPRKEICKKFGIVDHTARCYLSKFYNTPGMEIEYRKVNNHGEYKFTKIAAAFR